MDKKRLFVYIDEASIEEKPKEEVFCAVIVEEKNLKDYRNKINNLRLEILDDPIYSEPYCGKKNQKALKKSFHMTEISPDTRERFLELIRYFAFEVLIYVYHDSLDEETKRCDYIKKLYKHLKQRYTETDFTIIWEDESTKIHWPAEIPILRVKKGEDALLEISDCIAWIFCRKYYENYIKKEDFEKNRDKKYYTIFEDKIRKEAVMKLTANNIIKLFIDAIGQDAFKDFYEHNWEARKKEIQKLLKTEYDFDIINDRNFQRFWSYLNSSQECSF